MRWSHGERSTDDGTQNQGEARARASRSGVVAQRDSHGLLHVEAQRDQRVRRGRRARRLVQGHGEAI